MPTGIMSGPTVVTVDVRDMLCAQALAVVAQAVAPLRRGALLEILFNAEDVKRDLLVWARSGGHAISEGGPGVLRVTPLADG